MTLQRSILAAVAVALLALAQLSFASAARAGDLPACASPEVTSPEFCHTVDPHDTDPQILDTVPSRGDHLVFLGPKKSRVGRLLVFLPTGGPTNKPSEFSYLGTEARRLGYHTILLAYRNEAPIAASPTPTPPMLPGCGRNEHPDPTSPDCAIKMRTELLEGDVNAPFDSPLVDVNPANGIYNRLDKLLQYLKANHSDDGWGRFVDDDGKPKWSKTVLVGSSLGAGQAVLIAEEHNVYRAALLHGWVDANHGWVKAAEDGETPSESYFTLIHARDQFFGRTCPAYAKLGLTPSCPLAAFPIPTVQKDPNPALVENRPDPPFGTSQLVFNLDPGSTAGMGDHFHQSTSRDAWTAKEEPGGVIPSHHLVNAWRTLLGDKDADTCLDEVDDHPDVRDAADTDGDGVLDACDSHRQGPR